MKTLAKMSQEEINNLTDTEFKNIHPFEKRSCFDCKYLVSALSWWCTNKEASKLRGTSIPGCIKCIFWEVDWLKVDKKFCPIKKNTQITYV